MLGLKEFEKSFTRLIKGGALSHSYMFYGEPQVGKRLFAGRLANYLEFKKFEAPSRPLTELIQLLPAQIEEKGNWAIRINDVRALKNFLFQKPVNSKYRVAIINDAHMLTDDAQDALLKITEEPPEHSLLILVVNNPEVLLSTVQSRFQKIYFPTSRKKEIKNMLVSELGLDEKKAEKIADISFGRPGRAIDLAKNEDLIKVSKEAESLIKSDAGLKETIAYLSDPENKDKINGFLSALIAEFAVDVRRNYEILKKLTVGYRRLNEWNVNRRIQLEAALNVLSQK